MVKFSQVTYAAAILACLASSAFAEEVYHFKQGSSSAPSYSDVAIEHFPSQGYQNDTLEITVFNVCATLSEGLFEQGISRTIRVADAYRPQASVYFKNAQSDDLLNLVYGGGSKAQVGDTILAYTDMYGTDRYLNVTPHKSDSSGFINTFCTYGPGDSQGGNGG